MRKILALLLLFIFITKPVLADYVDLTVSYPKEAIYGEEIRITFEIINNSNDRLWDGTITIDDSFFNKYKVYIKSERNYDTNPFEFSIIEPGRSFKESFILTFEKDTPIDKASFKIILKCGKGMCRGGCAPFYLEKTVNIDLNEKNAEVLIRLDENEFTAYKGENIEIPFLIDNIGDIQIRNVSAEIKGDINSDNIVNISYINPGNKTSDKLVLSIDENASKTSLNPIIVVKFLDPNGNEGLIYENIKINIVEEEHKPETIIASNDTNTTIVKRSPPLLFYVLIFLSILSIILVFAFVIYLIKYDTK
ncbi:MAG: hypothetical protein GYA51_04905 [Candidatus Methanofastidiosa archaeon]|nr:hypothetical protein [Candidatus Methanofastidiosa archaeon]